MKKALKKQSYQSFISEISSLYERARTTVVETYWQIGKRIIEVEQAGDIRAQYGSHLLTQVSKDLSKKYGKGFSVRNVRNMRGFYLSNQKRQTSAELTWAKQVELLPLKNTTARKRITARAVKEKLSARQVRRLVRDENVRYGTKACRQAQRGKGTNTSPLLRGVADRPGGFWEHIIENGTYLNQELITRGLVTVWEG